VLERARLQTGAVLAAGRAGEEYAAPFAAVAEDGPVGEIYAGAAASIAHDWDDYLYMGHTGHSAVWTARAFAPDDADRALAAQIAGNEVAGRLGAALFFGPHNGQFWSSIHCGGAAVAAGVALGLDGERIAHALAIALYQPPFGVWPGFMGPRTKLLTAAEPAAQGARAALLAAEGVTGALDVVENPRGFLRAFSFAPRPAMLGALGNVWLTDTIAFKPLPGCAYVQSALQGLLSARLEADDVESIEVHAGYLTIAMEDLRPADGLTPAGINFSVARSLAVALIAGRLTHEELDPDWLAANADRVEEVAARVRVRHDTDLTTEMLSGLAAGGATAADLSARDWLRVLGGVRASGAAAPPVPASDLLALVRDPALRRALRGGGGGIDAIDTGALRLAFPSRLCIRLRSGRTLDVEGKDRGAAGSPLAEQRAVVEEKCRLAGLEVAAAG
jgi:hypothetical protein